MSSRLVEERLKRIRDMKVFAKKETLKGLHNGSNGFILKDWFVAYYMVNLGVRERLTLEYFDMLVKAGIFEENTEQSAFRSLEGLEEFEKEKQSVQPQTP